MRETFQFTTSLVSDLFDFYIISIHFSSSGMFTQDFNEARRSVYTRQVVKFLCRKCFLFCDFLFSFTLRPVLQQMTVKNSWWFWGKKWSCKFRKKTCWTSTGKMRICHVLNVLRVCCFLCRETRGRIMYFILTTLFPQQVFFMSYLCKLTLMQGGNGKTHTFLLNWNRRCYDTFLEHLVQSLYFGRHDFL